MQQRIKSFKKVSYYTLIVLFLLIGMGGLVRVTGSGMGCPDWPKCFGLWIPPTCECQLPNNYHEVYKDHDYREGSNFDVVKTWVEYFNRLLGVITGFFVILTLYQAYKIRSLHSAIYYGALFCLILVLLEGALGAMVVKLNLQTQSVTLHYLLAILLVCSLLYSIAALKKMQEIEVQRTSKKEKFILLSALLLSTIQLMSGTNLRSISGSLSGITMNEWLDGNEIEFTMHRLYALLVMVSIYFLWRNFKRYRFSQFSIGVIWVSVIGQIITGVFLNYFDFPKIAHTLHILLPAIIFCSQFYIFSFIIIKRKLI